jgi:hypothetical protein
VILVAAVNPAEGSESVQGDIGRGPPAAGINPIQQPTTWWALEVSGTLCPLER